MFPRGRGGVVSRKKVLNAIREEEQIHLKAVFNFQSMHNLQGDI